MIKIFLTGDNHIGIRYGGHAKARALADARVEAFQNMVAKANEEECDLFAIAGDLFDSTKGAAKKDLVKLVDYLGGFHGMVLIIPGNHDYYSEKNEGGVWRAFREAARGRTNFLLMTEYRPYELNVGDERVIVYPAGCRSRHSLPNENNLGWMREEAIQADGVYRIGMAHGAVKGESLDREGNYFPMSREELAAIPVDVWLIGHTHVPFSGGRVFNAGTHAQTDVACSTEGQCFIIEVGEAEGQKPVRAKKYASGLIRFCRREVSVTAGSLERALEEGLGDIPDQSVAEVILSGALTPEEYADRDRIIQGALARFVEGTYDDYGLSRQITQDLIASEFPETSFSAQFLTALLNDPKEAQMAYDLLKGAPQ